MRDNTYLMAFLIATAVMLLAGLAVNGYEIYQYTSYTSDTEITTNKSPTTPETSPYKSTGDDKNNDRSAENGETTEE